jgi:hypothetical protein
MNSQTPFLRSAARGAATGLVISLPFVAWVVVLVILNGSLTVRMRHDHLVSAPGTIVMLLAAGAILGTVIGTCWRMMRSVVGAVAIGMLMTVPVATLTARLLEPEPFTSRRGLLIICFLTVVLGPIIGLNVRSANSEADTE